MKIAAALSSFLLCTLLFSNAQAADGTLLLQLASCEESWTAWDRTSPKADEFRKQFATDFKQTGRGASFAPIKPMSILGHSVSEVYPDSIAWA